MGEIQARKISLQIFEKQILFQPQLKKKNLIQGSGEILEISIFVLVVIFLVQDIPCTKLHIITLC